MTNRFDVERAKRGEPIQFCEGSPDGKIPARWVDVRFIGLMSSGEVVVEHQGGTLRTSALRMKPKSKYALIFHTLQDAESFKQAALHELANRSMGVQIDITELPGDE